MPNYTVSLLLPRGRPYNDDAIRQGLLQTELDALVVWQDRYNHHVEITNSSNTPNECVDEILSKLGSAFPHVKPLIDVPVMHFDTIVQFTGWKKSQVKELILDPHFPRGYSRLVYWYRGEVYQYLSNFEQFKNSIDPDMVAMDLYLQQRIGMSSSI